MRPGAFVPVIAGQQARSAVLAPNVAAIHDEQRHDMNFERLTKRRFSMDARIKPAHGAEILPKAE